MYIDIFICIQIGPSQQKTNTHTIHMSEFCHRRFFVYGERRRRTERGGRTDPVLALRMSKSKSPGRETLQAEGENERAPSRDPKCFLKKLKIERGKGS